MHWSQPMTLSDSTLSYHWITYDHAMSENTQRGLIQVRQTAEATQHNSGVDILDSFRDNEKLYRQSKKMRFEKAIVMHLNVSLGW